MKTISIQKKKSLSVSEMADRWWNSKSVFFSAIAEEDFTNKEVILVHLILVSFLLGAAFVDTCFIISVLAILVSAVCVKLLNRTDNKNDKVIK